MTDTELWALKSIDEPLYILVSLNCVIACPDRCMKELIQGTARTGVTSPAAERPSPQVIYLAEPEGGLLLVGGRGSRLALGELHLGTLTPGSFLERPLSEPSDLQGSDWRKPCLGSKWHMVYFKQKSLVVVGRDPAFCVSSDTDHGRVLGGPLHL